MIEDDEITDGEFNILLVVEVRLDATDMTPGVDKLTQLRLKAKALEIEIAESDFTNGIVWSSYEPELIRTNID